MLEATLENGATFKRLIDSVKEFVQEANWECNESGIALQAMDTSHVALVALLLRAQGFEPYRCDRNMTLGINVQSMAKVLKCATAEDRVSLSAMDSGELLTFKFEGRNERVSEYELKLLEIDADQLGVPEPEYEASFSMSSHEFSRIARDLVSIGENLKITLLKNSVTFAVEGELGSGSVTLKQTASIDDDDNAVIINADEPISLVFSGKYLQGFSKSASLASRVSFFMSLQAPLMIEYKLEELGYLRFYLAPKIGDEDAENEADMDMDMTSAKAEPQDDDY